jgi:hypothetical protein
MIPVVNIRQELAKLKKAPQKTIKKKHTKAR